MKQPELCIVCGRPMPLVRWWEWPTRLLGRPPFHDPSKDKRCMEIFEKRVRTAE